MRFLSVLIAATIGLALAPPTCAFAQVRVKNPSTVCAPSYKTSEAKVDGFTFKSYKRLDTAEACLQVIRGGRVIYQNTAQTIVEYTLGQAADTDTGIQFIANGTDITGRARPDMIVSLDTGGAHCCHLTYVFELRPKFLLLAAIDAEHGDSSHFEELGDEQHFYYSAYDWTFAYWPFDFAESPVAPIQLRYVDDPKGGAYHLALDKMVTPAPTNEEWQQALSAAQSNFTEDNWRQSFGATLWTTVMHLIYAGHSDLAWKFLDEAWPAALASKDQWLRDFCGILKTGKYWQDLASTLQNAPKACNDAKPHGHFPSPDPAMPAGF